MTDKQLMQETECNIEIATKSLANATINTKEIGRMMEERIPKIIRQTYELYEGNSAKAQKAVLEMGYTKEDILQCGYDVDI